MSAWSLKHCYASVKVDGQDCNRCQTMIKDFMENAEKGFFQAMLDHLEKQREAFALEA